MRATNPGFVDLTTLFLCGLLAAGAFMGSRLWLDRRRDVADRAAAMRHEAALGALRNEGSQLRRERELARQRKERAMAPVTPASVAPDRGEAVQALAELRRENQVMIMGGRHASSTATAELAGLFKLPLEQAASLHAAHQRLRDEVGRALGAHVAARSENDTTVVITMSPAPELANAVGELRATCAAILGTANLAAYDQLVGFNRLLAEVGADYVDRSGTATVTRDPSRRWYRVSVEKFALDGGRFSSSISGRNLDGLRSVLGPLSRFVPADF